MNVVTRPSSRTHTIIAVAAVAWNVLGLVLFLMQVTMSAEQVAALAPPDRAMYEATPAWVLGAFGVAVVAGVVGSVGLFARQRWPSRRSPCRCWRSSSRSRARSPRRPRGRHTDRPV